MPVGRDTHRDGSPRIDRSGSGLQRSQGFPSSWRSPDADDLGDLVDPQNDTYEEEGTHGLAMAATLVMKGIKAARKTEKGREIEGKLKQKGAEAVSKGVDYVKDEGNQDRAREALNTGISKSKGAISKVVDAGTAIVKGKGGAGLASPASEGIGTPEDDEPLA
jgi:hypothetical protein